MKWMTGILLATASVNAFSQELPSRGNDRWVLTGTKVYVAPDQPPLDDAWVVVKGGRIEAVGEAPAAPPAETRIHAACSGGVITAGFQNSHVHFTDEAFADAAGQARADLERALERMLTRFGYTTVVDTGSDIANTAALRRRIENGEIKGPRIITTGTPLYPQDGIPFYLRDLPPELLEQLPVPATEDEARAFVRSNFEHGADGTKLFVATPQEQERVKRMSVQIARAAAAETHRRGGVVMAHPTDPQGVSDSVAGNVDIIVHTTIDSAESSWSDALIRDMVARNVALIPTLKLGPYELGKRNVPVAVREKFVRAAERQLRRFLEAGGQVLFGTDVGYMADFDPTEEYVLMARAGLTPMQILASLTTAPASRWGEAGRRGRIRPGFDADLVVLDGDPAADVRHFAAVKCAFRAGGEMFVRTARSQ